MADFHPLTGLSERDSDDQTLRLATAGAAVTVTAITDHVLRVTLTPSGAPEHRTWALDPGVATLPVPATRLAREEGTTWLRAGGIAAATDAGGLRFTRPDGSVIVAEAAPAWSVGAAGGARWDLALAPGELIMGGGMRTGGLNQRGRTLTLWATDPMPDHDERTDAMYQSVSFFTGLRDGQAWGIFFDSPWRATVDIGQTNPDRLTYQTTGPDLVAYLCAGPRLADVLEQYTTLTGRMPPLPRWALGNQQSRWSYLSADEVRAVAAGFRDHQIPCDAIYLDIDYMRGFRDFTFNPTTFPDPRGLISDLAARGFQVVPIIDPGLKVDPEFSVYQDGLARGAFVRDAAGAPVEGYVWPGRSVWADFAQPAVRAWWGDLHRELVTAGVAGIWDDMNEPTQSGMSAPPDVTIPFGTTLPLDARHGPADAPISHAEFHNAYGQDMAQATREGLARLRPDRRPFVLSRAGGAGGQRHAIFWNGDNSSLWAHVRLGITMNLGLGLSGYPVTGFDIGGFWRDTNPELLTRFYQVGAWLGFCRNHSALGTARQEPWVFGEPYTSHIRAAVARRYSLLPYFVTLAWAATRTGAPIIRPLAWLAPTDPASVACDDQFLVGDDLLIAPVLEAGATTRAVTLPPGTWFHWADGSVHTGPARLSVPVDLATTPIFSRAGAIIPTASVTQHTGVAEGPLTLEAHLAGPGSAAVGEIWDDDDHPDAAARGTYLQLRTSATWDGDLVTLRLERVGGQWPGRYATVRWLLRVPPGYQVEPLDATEGALAGPTLVTRFHVRH